MIDLTLNKEDRDKFITKLYLKEDANQYVVKYASGRIEEMDFTVHNFNASVLLMEEQFLQYREEYVKRNMKLQAKMQAEKLIEALIGILGFVVTAIVPVPDIVKGILMAIIVLYSFCYQASHSKAIELCQVGLNVIGLTDEFLKMKDKFKMTITDPQTGLDEVWYLLTLSGIEELRSVRELKMISGVMTDEVKQEERERTEFELNKRMSL